MRLHVMQGHLMYVHHSRVHASVRPVGVTEEDLLDEWHALLARHATVCGALEAELRQRHDIGVTEFEALERLATGPQGKCRGVELTEAVHLSQSAASRLVARMERDGLVERTICEVDRRGIFVALTEKG